VLVEQGSSSDDLFLLLNGVLVVEVDDEKLAELGPGAVVGERAVLEGGTRTATLRAVTECKVAVAPSDQIDVDKLAALASGHRREEVRR
jgi:CRP-like cAMP-binding protein